MSNEQLLTSQSLHGHLLNQLASSFTVPLVTVFCGARTGHGEAYIKDATMLGTGLVKHGMGLVYGGASIGVMGALADGVMDNHGVAVGVIPEFLLQKEVAHKRLSKLYITDNMHTRKAIMAHLASAFVVLAGGFGTLEEMFEIATWRQLAQHQKPLILVNSHGFYDYLIAHLTNSERMGFMASGDLDNIIICPSIEACLNLLGTQLNLTN